MVTVVKRVLLLKLEMVVVTVVIERVQKVERMQLDVVMEVISMVFF